MKQIYQNAEEVIVWLGLQSDDSDGAMDFIHFLSGMHVAQSGYARLRRILLDKSYREKWIAFRNFFLRRWWTRIWTVQEFVVQSKVCFWCGLRQLNREGISCALLVADTCGAPEFKDTVAFHHAWNRRRAWVLHGCAHGWEHYQFELSLVAMAAYFCSNDATDDRDRLYGLYGLCTISNGIEIDYALSVDEVYLRFAQSFVAGHNSLDILSFASLFAATPTSSLPSWVPDWRARVQPLVVPLMVSQSANMHVGNLRPPGYFSYSTDCLRYSAAGSRAGVYKFEGRILLVHGRVIDAIDGLAGNRHFQLVQSSEQHSRHSESAGSSPADILMSICRSLTLDRQDRYLQFAMPTEDFYNDFTRLCKRLVAEDTKLNVQKAFRDWFHLTSQLLIHGTSLLNLLLELDDGGWRSDPNQEEYVQDTFYGRFFDVVQRMSLRLMTSRRGRIGMVAENAMKGDLVCLLYGCSVPIILRKHQHKNEFTVVGECFLDGCMNGEALDQGNAFDEIFRIV